MYSGKKKSLVGIIPNDQNGLMKGIRDAVAKAARRVIFQFVHFITYAFCWEGNWWSNSKKRLCRILLT